MTKAIIFDFDGTIADSFDIFVQTLSEILKREALTPDEIRKLRGSSISDILRYFKISRLHMPKLLVKGRLEIAKKMEQVEIFDGVEDVLSALFKKDYKIYILSSNSVQSIYTFLDKYGMSTYISNVYGGISIVGKAAHIKKLLKREFLLANETVYVGDEVRDIEAAQKVKMKCISVTWGYSTKDSLKAHSPFAIVSTPKALLEILES